MSDPAIPAATLILVREHRPAEAPELLMVERARDMAFAGGALVFPGGRIDEADRALARELGLGNDGPARIAAIRETIEETAVPAGLHPRPREDHVLELQSGLVAGHSLAHLLQQAGLELDPGALTPFAHWIPKLHATRRFDTLFFIARASAGDWRPHVLPGECAGAWWTTAADVLDRDRKGETRLIFPTRRTLERLALHSSFGSMLADARAHPLEPITPSIEEQDGERYVTIPEGLGYPVTREKLEGLWRG